MPLFLEHHASPSTPGHSRRECPGLCARAREPRARGTEGAGWGAQDKGREREDGGTYLPHNQHFDFSCRCCFLTGQSRERCPVSTPCVCARAWIYSCAHRYRFGLIKILAAGEREHFCARACTDAGAPAARAAYRAACTCCTVAPPPRHPPVAPPPRGLRRPCPEVTRDDQSRRGGQRAATDGAKQGQTTTHLLLLAPGRVCPLLPSPPRHLLTAVAHLALELASSSWRLWNLLKFVLKIVRCVWSRTNTW